MKKPFVISLLALSVLLFSSLSYAKSYSVESIRIDAIVGSDGLIRVREQIAYDFQGEFSYAYRDIPLKPGEELVDVGVGEGGVEFERSERRSLRTYSVSRIDDRGVRITWYYSAEDERRTFTVSYTAKGVVRRYPDVAEIYYKFVGEEWDRPIGRVDVEVTLPPSVERSAIRAWAHGPLYGTLRILPSAVISLNVAPLPAGTFWEARIVCPGDAFGSLGLAAPEPRLNHVLEEETAWAEQSNRLRKEQAEWREAAAIDRERRTEKANGLLPVSILLGLAALGIWLQFFLRHGRPHAVAVHAAPGEVPSGHPPAAISYLVNRSVTGPAVAATLLDLANRGYLEVHETIIQSKSLFGRNKKQMDYRFDVVAKPLSELEPFERDLLQFVLNEAGDSNGFAVSDLRRAASKRRTEFRRFFRAWGKNVQAYCASLRFFEPYPVRAMVANGVCGGLIIGSGIVLSVVSLGYVGVPAIICGFLEVFFTVFLTRRTPEGQRLLFAWKAFRSHLKSVCRALGPVTLRSPEWGRYLSAAIVFGLHKKLMPNLRFDDGRETGVYPVWFYGVDPGGVDGGMSGLASGLSTMVDAVSTTMSSAAGAGGGASAGGGGGSGGGGGGAG
jgi:uncharacterized membrane protein